FFTSSNVFITNTNKFRIVRETYDFNNNVGGPSFHRAQLSLPSCFWRIDCFQMEVSDNLGCRLLADLFTDLGGKRRQNAENRNRKRVSC
ncbi:MAG: hypothetical protein P8Z74_14820, partial [Acidobacteriota bacterium]